MANIFQNFGSKVGNAFTNLGQGNSLLANQSQIANLSDEDKNKLRKQGLQKFADTMFLTSAIGSGDANKIALAQNKIRQRKLDEEDAKRKAALKDIINNSNLIPDSMKGLAEVYPELFIKSILSPSQTYKPDLTTYKNVTDQTLNIGGIKLKPGESRPFNTSNPKIANALMKTSGIDEVSNQMEYTRQGGLYSTPEGEYQVIITGGQRYFDGPPVVLPDGTTKSRLTTDEFYSVYDPNEVSTTTSAEGYRYTPDLKTFMGMDKDLVALEKSMFQIDNYWQNIKDSNVGIKRLGDQISQWWKTYTYEWNKDNDKNLTPEELARGMAEGRLQGLIGANRIDTVGGGVMTEKDAWRVIARMGGDVDTLQNPEVVAPLLQELFQLKTFDYNKLIKSYNNAVESDNFPGYEKRKPIDKSSVVSKFSLLPKGIPLGSEKVTINNKVLYRNGDIYYAVLPDGTVAEVDIDG